MSTFSFDRARRWARFNSEKSLARRPDSALPFLIDGILAGSAILPDSSVYIDGLKGILPSGARDLLEARTVNHSTIAIQELMHLVGRLDPQNKGTKVIIEQIGATIRLMSVHRVFTPDADVLGRAALLSGVLCRLQGYQKDQKLRALHACVLYLQAMKLGITVLTANVSDFDYLLQLLPTGKVLLYSPVRARGSLDA